MRKVSTILAAALILLSGCSANYHSIYRHQPVETTPTITLVDAKQRAILSSGPKATADKAEITKFCAEPSPDVFSVIAQALSGGASFGKSADPATVQAALNAAFSTSEQGSTIPRTQTTNVLREVMFRTCERFLNGGIQQGDLALQAARDQRMIVSILAIEGLTGAVAAKPVVIGVAANGSGGASGADAAVRLDDQNKLVQKKAEAVGKKQAAYDEQNGAGKDCETIAKAVADKKEDSLTQALKDKRPKCEAAAGELDVAKKEKSDADAHYKALAGIAAIGGIPVSAGGALMTPVANGALDTTRSSDMATVADAVQAIVMGTFDQDEMQLTCLKAFQDDSMQGLRAQCSEYLKSRVAVETARNLATEAQIKAAKAGIEDQTNALFERFWAQVSKDGALDGQKLEALQKKFGNEWPQCFAGTTDKTRLSECFSSLRAQQKRDLAEGNKSNGKP